MLCNLTVEEVQQWDYNWIPYSKLTFPFSSLLGKKKRKKIHDNVDKNWKALFMFSTRKVALSLIDHVRIFINCQENRK